MPRTVCLIALVFSGVAANAVTPPDTQPVGPADGGGQLIPTSQLVRPAGQTLEIAGRPVCVAVAPDGATLFAKTNRAILVVDAQSWSVRQELPFDKDGGSMAGIAVSLDGGKVYATTSGGALVEAEVGASGRLSWARRIVFPGPGGTGNAYPCGIALSRDAQRAIVCLSRNNTLAVVDLATAEIIEIAVGVAPTSVALTNDDALALVTNWGGRRARDGDRTADSAGTPVIVDERGIAASGTASLVDLHQREVVAELAVGLSPVAVAVHPSGAAAYVASANEDTVALIDLARRTVTQTLIVRADERLPVGSMPNGLAVAPDGATLYVSLAGSNAIAVVAVEEQGRRLGALRGLIPAGWYPGGLAVHGDRLYAANIKGVGSRTRTSDQPGWNSHGHRGSLIRVDRPDAATLARYTEQVRADARVPQILRTQARAGSGAQPVPVPARAGEPSVFKHVVYVIKENRTYDQVFGDIPRGNGDPALCIYGREVTPNHHALAEQFVLLDNFYCNGVLSADGHSWATEGNVTPYLERAFGGFVRSYTFGDDPLTYSSSGFVWDHVLAVQGLTFRNYGEFDYAETVPPSKYVDVYRDFVENTNRIRRKQKIGVERLRRYSCPDYPGWNMDIPDVLRAAVFLKELAEFEQNGDFPSFCVVYLPNDHTSGTTPGAPTPRSLVADNDLALGRIVEGISRSRFWPQTCIFVIEDDPQDGFDHVDGHRSIALVISPYTKRGVTISRFYNQTSVIHTMERILGRAPAGHQLYALAPLMTDCFMEIPDLTPYTCLPNIVPLAELTPPKSAMTPAEQVWAAKSEALPLAHPDGADEDTLNRILWHAAKGTDAAYPAHLAGAHGRGLAALGLRHAAGAAERADGPCAGGAQRAPAARLRTAAD